MKHKNIFILMFPVLLMTLPVSCGTSAGSVMPKESSVPVIKRGVSYSFEKGNTPGEDMDLLMPAVGWFYSWGSFLRRDVDKAARERSLVFFPMAWHDVYEKVLRGHLDTHPDCEYILAYNEPNLTDQANLTPKKAAKRWPKLVKIAGEYNLKIVSPALNYGNLEGYGDPIVWLDEFFGVDTVDDKGRIIKKNKGFRKVSLDDVVAIGVHCYMPDAYAVKRHIERFKKYNKPIWLTEFCAWDSIDWNNTSIEKGHELQGRYMSELIPYLELDLDVERYSWFIPKGDETPNEAPFNKLLTKTKPPQLTDLGFIYANMGSCDRSVFIPQGQRIEAAHYSNCNVFDSLNKEGLSRPVHFRKGTDTDGLLDVYNFSKGKWLEYQLNMPLENVYTLSLRNNAAEETQMDISVNGRHIAAINLPQSELWTTAAVPLQMDAGKNIVRLAVASGNCSLNWLQAE